MKNKRQRAKPPAWLGVVQTRHPRNDCMKLCFPRAPIFLLSEWLHHSSAQQHGSSVGFTALTTPLESHWCFPWRRERGNCKRQSCSGNICICTRLETALTAQKKKKEGIRQKTNSHLHTLYTASAEKVSYSSAKGKRQIAPNTHK